MTPWIGGYLFVAWWAWYPLARFVAPDRTTEPRIVLRSFGYACIWPLWVAVVGLTCLYAASKWVYERVLGEP